MRCASMVIPLRPGSHGDSMLHWFGMTPKSRKTVLFTAAALFVTVPLVVAQYYYAELRHESFPIEADSIGLPIFGFVVVLLATAPVTWAVVGLCAHRYPGAVSLATWNRERPLWSAFWTCAFTAAALVFLLLTPWSGAARHPFLIAHVLIDLYFLLVLRSGLVAQVGSVAPLTPDGKFRSS